MHVINTERVPIKIWTPEGDVESQALAQLKRTASLPCIFKHIAVMPDVHWGIGATVGSVVATEGAIIPAAVGVDIGCGMMAVKLLARQHRAVETKIKSVRSVYVKAQAESERVRERSTGKARREAQLDVTHLQVGIDVCDELLAALAKQGKGGR